ncbi:MAG: radical SAM protein [Elusimicrobia bacterium]|nr:radical SAM protein [Elusimicrobiota bacterium]
MHPPDTTKASFDFEVGKRGGYYNFPPYGLGVLAQKVAEAGMEAKITGLHNHVLMKCRECKYPEAFDYDKIWKSKLHEDISEFQPDLVAVTCLFTMTYEPFKEVCREIKNAKPAWLDDCDSIPVAVGGVHVTQYLDTVLNDLPEAEFAFFNESEIAFVKFVGIVNGDPVEGLAQTAFNAPNEKLLFRESSKPGDADVNVIPRFDLIAVSKYTDNGRVGSFTWTAKPGAVVASVLTNRGCRAACTFCNVRNFNGIGVRGRSVESVLEELHILKEEHGVGHITWLDDDLLNNEKRAIQLFNEMVRKNFNFSWDAMNGVIAFSCKDEVIAAAAESGCKAVNIGVESGNGEIQNQIKKPGTSKTFLQAAQVFRKYDSINARLFLMLGFPGETHRMIADTITLALEMNLDWHSITILQPWLTTPIYETMAEQGLIEEKQKKLEGRYSAGPFGQQRSVESNDPLLLENFRSYFRPENIDRVPPKDKLLEIWFFMNYYLNFHRLFWETRKHKLEQQLRNLDNICTIVAPGNGFAVYFRSFLQHRLFSRIDSEVILDMEKVYKTSKFWPEVFEGLGLHLDHVRSNNFPDRSAAKEELGLEHITPGWFRSEGKTSGW